MKKILLFFIIIIGVSLVGCTAEKPSEVRRISNHNKEMSINNQVSTKEKNQTVEQKAIKIDELLGKEIPIPDNAQIIGHSLEFPRSWKGNVVPNYLNLLEKNGWEYKDALGSKRIYKKVIKGNTVVISLIPIEKGGPEQEQAKTIISFEIEEIQ